MAPFMHRSRSVDGVEVEPGARLSRPIATPRFSVVAVCESVEPDRWVGELQLNSRVVATTEQHATPDAACRAAENLLIDRLVVLLEAPVGPQQES